jgi:hypothetical protein
LAYQVFDFVTGDETYFIYQDPATSDCASPIPFGVRGLFLAICFETSCSTSIQFDIYDAVEDVCPAPGDLLFTTGPGPLMVSGGPQCGVLGVTFADTACVDGPFFLAYTLPDSVDCFDIVLDTLPGACVSYVHRSGQLYDLADYALPGQLWMYAVGLDSAQSGCQTVPEDTLWDIPGVYANIQALVGQVVRVFGEYVTPEDSKLVSVYGEYERWELGPPSSILLLDGLLPDSAYWYGGTMIVTGALSTAPNPTPSYPQDSLLITITASSFEYIAARPDTTDTTTSNQLDTGPQRLRRSRNNGCDSCSFAILIGGSTDPARNQPSMWATVESLYVHKTRDTAEGGEGYCPENVEVIYNNGVSGNPGVIPNSEVDSLSQQSVQDAIDSVAAGVAECERKGKPATVQKMSATHGKDDSGMVVGAGEYLTPEEMRRMQQGLIDSCADEMYDEFLHCYGGDMIDSLKGLDDQGKTEIHVNGPAGPNSPSWPQWFPGWTGAHAYLLYKIKRLQAGDDYETAVAEARWLYRVILELRQWRYQRKIDSLTGVSDTLPPGPKKTHVDNLKNRYENLKNRVQGAIDEGSPGWVRYQFKEYCQWKKVTCPPNGQLKFEFKGSGGCGNIKVYVEGQDGKKTRLRTWNWNLPGSPGYQPGNETRYLNNGSNRAGTYWIHNDNGQFTLTVSSLATQENPESPSNHYSFAGGSAGGNDGSWEEFGYYVTPWHGTVNTFGDNFSLGEVPGIIGVDGALAYSAAFEIQEYNEWWSDMAVWIVVHEVLSPGILGIEFPQAESLYQEVEVTEPGEYLIPVGGVDPSALSGELIFHAEFKQGASYSWDCWGLRTLVPTGPIPVCGDADANGIVNVSDAVYLITYIFGGGPPPDPLELGDCTCDGVVNISDVVYLIAYIFGGGNEPCDPNGDGIPDC